MLGLLVDGRERRHDAFAVLLVEGDRGRLPVVVGLLDIGEVDEDPIDPVLEVAPGRGRRSSWWPRNGLFRMNCCPRRPSVVARTRPSFMKYLTVALYGCAGVGRTSETFMSLPSFLAPPGTSRRDGDSTRRPRDAPA